MVLELNPNGGSPPSAVLLFIVQTMRRVWRSDDMEKIKVLPSSHSFHQRRSLRHPMPRRLLSCRAYDRSAPHTCNVGTCPMVSRPHCRTEHMPLLCCIGTRRCQSTATRSMSRSLPNRCMWWWMLSCDVLCLVCAYCRP
jgi:hypothetical protein